MAFFLEYTVPDLIELAFLPMYKQYCIKLKSGRTFTTVHKTSSGNGLLPSSPYKQYLSYEAQVWSAFLPTYTVQAAEQASLSSTQSVQEVSIVSKESLVGFSRTNTEQAASTYSPQKLRAYTSLTLRRCLLSVSFLQHAVQAVHHNQSVCWAALRSLARLVSESECVCVTSPVFTSPYTKACMYVCMYVCKTVRAASAGNAPPSVGRVRETESCAPLPAWRGPDSGNASRVPYLPAFLLTADQTL